MREKWEKSCKYHSTRLAGNVSWFKVVKELLARLPEHARIIAILWRFRDCIVQHHLFNCMRQNIDAILQMDERERE